LSSTYLAYCTEAYQPLLRQQPIRFVVLPILVTVGCFALFLPADSVLPWTREERLIGLAILDYACVTYHFAAQHLGALSLYRSRADRLSSIQTRRLDRFFRADSRRRSCLCGRHARRSGRLPGPVGRSLVPRVDCVG
jgi:hypothetical protein